LNAKVFVGNLPKATTQEELSTLFAQAGEVAATDIITDRKSGEANGFPIVTMSA